jgi:hypothetical protein
MEQYGVDSDEIWLAPGGKSWVVMHKALERIATNMGIAFEDPKYLPDSDVKQGFVTILVAGSLGEIRAWAFGEASPKNNKNAYPVAMAEKRAKDRVILKLLNTHGTLYSESEADEFIQPDAPEDFITRDDGIQVLTKDAQRLISDQLQKEILNCDTVEHLKRWKNTAKSKAARLTEHWRVDLNQKYLDHLRALEKRDADEYIERMTG